MSGTQTSDRTCADCRQGAVVSWGSSNEPMCLDHLLERLGWPRRVAVRWADIINDLSGGTDG